MFINTKYSLSLFALKKGLFKSEGISEKEMESG